MKKLIVLILLISQSHILNAKNSDEDKTIIDLYALTLNELLSVKIDIANRTPTELLKAPSSVTIFTKEQIQQMGLTTLEQLLVYVPGVQVVRGEGGGGSYSVSFRGRRSDAGDNRDILILLDGMRLNEPMSSGGMLQEAQLSLFNVERVEVIRGPGSALYGANAFLGVVNIITSKKSNILSANLGNFDRRGNSIQASSSINDWLWSFSAEYYQDEGEHYSGFYDFQGYTEDTQDPARRVDINLNVEFKGLSAKLRRSEREYQDYIVTGVQLNGLQRIKTVNESLQLKYLHNLDEHRFSYYLEMQEGLSDSLLGIFHYDPQPPGDPATGLYWTDGSIDAFVGGNIRTVKQKRVGVDANWQFNDSNQLAYGFVFRREESGLNPFQGNWDVNVLESSGELIPSPSDNFIQQGFYISGMRFDLLQPESRDVRGVYVQNESQLNSHWTLTLGLRNDDYDDFGSHTSVRGGLVYNNKNHFIKLLYGEAFRAPSLNETRAGIASGGISNPNLNPENVATSELVFGMHNNQWNTLITVYHNQFSDIIKPVLVDDVVPGITAFQPQNTGKESNTGLEFEMRFQLSNQWQFHVGGDYVFDELQSQHLANKHFFTNLDYRNENFTMNVKGSYVGKVIARDAALANTQHTVTLNDYWLADVNLRWRFSTINIILNIENIFDKTYQSYNPQFGLEQGLPSRGIGINVGLEYIFK